MSIRLAAPCSSVPVNSNVRRQEGQPHLIDTRMNTVVSSLGRGLLIGICVLLITAIIAFFVSQDGVSVNTEAWPATAKAIVEEHPGTPISADQWTRIEKALREHEGNSHPSHLLAAEVRKAWYIFLLVPALALAMARRTWPPLTLPLGIAISAPNVIAILVAFTHTHPYFK